MPEGDTIHKLARALEDEIAGAPVLRLAIEGQPVDEIGGRVISAIEAVGKHLLLHVGDRVVRSHLGMHGSWHRYQVGERWPRPRWQASVVLETRERVYVCWSAQEVELLARRGPRYSRFFASLGPDLLSPDGCDLATIVARARERGAQRPMCDVLLDQGTACGIGNVYKSELLFLERVHPGCSLDRLGDESVAAIYRRASELMASNLGPGMRRTQTTGGGDERYWVYRRQNEPCLKCGAKIDFAYLGKNHRSSYWCAGCQA